MMSSIQCQVSSVSSDPRALAMILPVIMVLAAAQTGEAQDQDESRKVTCYEGDVQGSKIKRYFGPHNSVWSVLVNIDSPEPPNCEDTEESEDKFITKFKCKCGPDGCGIKGGPFFLYKDNKRVELEEKDLTLECWGCKNSDLIWEDNKRQMKSIYSCDNGSFKCRNKVEDLGFNSCHLGDGKDVPDHNKPGEDITCQTKSSPDEEGVKINIAIYTKLKKFDLFKEFSEFPTDGWVKKCENEICECEKFGCVVMAQSEKERDMQWMQECEGCYFGNLVREVINEGTQDLVIKCEDERNISRVYCRNKAITRGYDSCKLGTPVGKYY